MNVKERLRAFIKHKGISIRKFCETIGVSATYINSMRKSIQPDKLECIAIYYPDLNIQWLLTGEGEMLKSTPSLSNMLVGNSNHNINIGHGIINTQSSNQELLNKITELELEIKSLKKELALNIDLLKSKDEIISLLKSK